MVSVRLSWCLYVFDMVPLHIYISSSLYTYTSVSLYTHIHKFVDIHIYINLPPAAHPAWFPTLFFTFLFPSFAYFQLLFSNTNPLFFPILFPRYLPKTHFLGIYQRQKNNCPADSASEWTDVLKMEHSYTHSVHTHTRRQRERERERERER
jgi:hypothetical protein